MSGSPRPSEELHPVVAEELALLERVRAGLSERAPASAPLPRCNRTSATIAKHSSPCRNVIRF